MTSLAAALILAGGAGRRLGGRDKPALVVAGRSLLGIAMLAVVGCPVVVVGPARELPGWVIRCREDPPGGGPAAGVVAGVAALPELPADAVVAVLAADLPGISSDTVDRRIAALSAGAAELTGAADPPGGAVLVDPGGHRQFLTGVWRLGSLHAAIGVNLAWTGRPLRELLSPITVVEVAGSDRETADVDTPDDWRRWQ
jgi:molybdopterin-guanine dinucleotide biosynthesis protein A